MKFTFTLAFLIALLALQSCSTELDVNAPYRETKVVYCILDPNQPYQTARITRGFLSDGRSAYEIAKIPDSSLYNPLNLEVKLLKLRKGNSGKFDTLSPRYELIPVTLNTKDTVNGDFYGPDQLVYQINTNELNLDGQSNPGDVKYCLRVRNKITGKVSEAYTQVPGNNFTIQNWPSISLAGPTGPFSLSFYSRNATKIAVGKSENSTVMQLNLNLKVAVITASDSTIENWQLRTGMETLEGSQTQVDFIFPPGSFWDFIRSEISKRGNTGVLRRRIIQSQQSSDMSDFEIFAANEDYNNYMIVNENYNSITQSQPVFSNISNGALGVFAAKNKKMFKTRLDNSLLDTLQVRFPDLKLVK